jgi:hypothetical protein
VERRLDVSRLQRCETTLLAPDAVARVLAGWVTILKAGSVRDGQITSTQVLRMVAAPQDSRRAIFTDSRGCAAGAR